VGAARKSTSGRPGRLWRLRARSAKAREHLGVRKREPGAVQPHDETVGVRKSQSAALLESPEERAHVVREERETVAPVGEFDRALPGGDLASGVSETPFDAGHEDPGGETAADGATSIKGDRVRRGEDPLGAERPRPESGRERPGIRPPVGERLQDRKGPPRAPPREIDPRLELPPAHAQVWVVLTETAERERRVVPEAGFDVASDDEPADTPEAEVGHHRRVGPEPDPKERARAPRGPEGEKRPSTGAHDPSVDAHRHPGRRGGKKSENAPRAAEPRQETDRKPHPETPRTRMRPGRFLATKDRPG
jgi:hypothetical protein